MNLSKFLENKNHLWAAVAVLVIIVAVAAFSGAPNQYKGSLADQLNEKSCAEIDKIVNKKRTAGDISTLKALAAYQQKCSKLDCDQIAAVAAEIDINPNDVGSYVSECIATP